MSLRHGFGREEEPVLGHRARSFLPAPTGSRCGSGEFQENDPSILPEASAFFNRSIEETGVGSIPETAARATLAKSPTRESEKSRASVDFPIASKRKVGTRFETSAATRSRRRRTAVGA